jgi:hypothetical protein
VSRRIRGWLAVVIMVSITAALSFLLYAMIVWWHI